MGKKKVAKAQSDEELRFSHFTSSESSRHIWRSWYGEYSRGLGFTLLDASPHQSDDFGSGAIPLASHQFP